MLPRFSIAHVTPHPWEAQHPVNEYVAQVCGRLSRGGHRVLILAPARTQEPVRASRQRLRAARRSPNDLLEDTDDGQPGLISVGEVLEVSATGGRRAPALPIDVARTVEEVLSTVDLDFVHVHEPFAPSTSSAALRHSRSLNVGSFHVPAEHLVATQMARRFVEVFFGRLDARTASFAATAELMGQHFPADYRVVMPGVDLGRAGDADLAVPAPAQRERDGGAAPGLRLVFIEREERAAQRLLMRALRRLPDGLAWSATVVSAHGESTSTPLRASLRSRVRFVAPHDLGRGHVLDHADVLICASDGVTAAPDLLLEAMARSVVPVASRLPVYDELLGDGQRGLLFEPGDADTLAAQLVRLAQDTALRERLRRGAAALAKRLTWERATDEMEAIYTDVAARRHDARATARVRRPLNGQALVDVDLHMHTDHSGDCATPVEVLLATAREQGLGAIAVTDHNEVAGALDAQAKAEGVKVIVGEEVKTASQGEVIGLFIERKIPRGLTMAETVAEIKRQGGLVYVPHPFDRLHSVPDYEHLLTILEDIDVIEVFNPRVAIGAFNEEAARFAAKYRIVAGAGSDSHVARGLGSVRIRMHDFEGPQEFLASLREADIITRPTSLLYVQALKFLETRATPPGARRARRARRVARATRTPSA